MTDVRLSLNPDAHGRLTYDVEGAQGDGVDHVDIALVPELVQLRHEYVGLLVHYCEETVQNLEVKRRRYQATPPEPL